MSEINNGGGMTLRDYFAGKAMQTLAIQGVFWEKFIDVPDDEVKEVTQFNVLFDESEKWEDLARTAYQIADAMLKARHQPERTPEWEQEGGTT